MGEGDWFHGRGRLVSWERVAYEQSFTGCVFNLMLFCPLVKAAKTKQRIREEQMQVIVIERGQQIQVQEQEIVRRERELDAQVRKPAEAEKFRLEKLAEANK